MAYINGNEILFSPQVTVVEGGVDIDVDTRMSDTSENPVQNKVVKAYVDEKTAPATDATYGTVKVSEDATAASISNGIYMTDNGYLQFVPATEGVIAAKSSYPCPITPSNLDYAVKVGITTNVNTLTDEEKAAAQEWLGMTEKLGDVEAALDSILAMQESLIGGGV